MIIFAAVIVSMLAGAGPAVAAGTPQSPHGIPEPTGLVMRCSLTVEPTGENSNNVPILIAPTTH